MKLNCLTFSIISALLVAPTIAFAGSIVPKQLAGPPSDFESMREVDPTSVGIHSKSALLPVEFYSAKAGGMSANINLPIEGERFRFLVLSGNNQNNSLSIRLLDSNGAIEKLGVSQAEPIDTFLGMGNAQHSAKFYSVNNAKSGNWNLNLFSNEKSKPTAYVLFEGDSNTQLYSTQINRKQFSGQSIGFVASLFDAEESINSGEKVLRKPAISSALMRVTNPNTGTVTNYPMFDDGQHADGAANDGIAGGAFVPTELGNYVVQVIANGSNRDGHNLVRTAEHIVPIVEQSISIHADRIESALVDNSRVNLALSISSQKSNLSHVRGYAEVWGTNAQGQAIPVAWVGGMIEPQNGKANFALDQRWITLAGAQAPFEMRNVRFEDPNYYVTLAKADRMPLDMPSLKMSTRLQDIVIDESMTMGPRPANLISSAKGVGQRLLLVHGYCSGGVWPQAQFANSSTFLDVNQNRSNDQFARLILSFGATWNSFGVVAHSQGGMAATHLYNYYWSGLDNATGARLIQSVGTPYKGTNLAGVLAALGSLFGVGCSSNTDLTYSGASSWLAGIANSSRAKVNYYTTSFRSTNWWTNDYCNFASDLVLSDPEDGTTEQTNGQLSGATNRGHTTGQCHTSGMRDPAQYLDSSRNSTMNANAAR